MSFSDYLEDKVLDHVFGGVAYTVPLQVEYDEPFASCDCGTTEWYY